MKNDLKVYFREQKDGGTVRYGLEIMTGEDECYENESPAMLWIKTETGEQRNYEKAYDSIKEEDGKYVCQAELVTENGSRFLFLDKFAIDCKKKEVLVERTVSVLKEGSGDMGFSTEFGLYLPAKANGWWTDEYEVFVPGIWYRKNKGVVKGAFASDLYQKNHYFRVTRMALPYMQMYRSGTGATVSFCHISPAPNTGVLEKSSGWFVDESLQYASLGITAGEKTMLKYVYPGSEGEINYIDRGESWAKRSHPVRSTVRHAYEFCIHFGHAAGSYEAMREEWRHWYSVYLPQIHRCNLEQAYEDGVQVIDTYCQPYHSVMGLPFWATVPEGNVCDISFQMGFVGQQTQCAYHLLWYGTQRQKPEMVEKGKQIIEFWVSQSTRESLFPQVWYEVFPPRFKPDYPSYLRTVADGMEGILNAYLWMKQQGEYMAGWLDFCRQFADNLRKVQRKDGSFARAYGKNGEEVHDGSFNTSNVIRFLVNLYFVTGDDKYKETALLAGEFCYENIYRQMAYIGGTADNDNTIDKEAGMQALYAFLALYDLTGERRWIEAAKGAADFCETWTYSWTFSVKPHKGNCVFHRADQTGLSLIATGHSHCDVMMGYCPYDYFRLYMLTGDAHYREFGEMILYNTKQTTDCERNYGYSYPGLVEESGELALQYHNGLGRWLPWCTIAEIETLTRLQEFFGQMKFPNEEKITDKKLKNQNYSQFLKR